MNLLLVVANYPHPGHPYSGAFNARSARALRNLGHRIEVLAPRPYLPRALAAWNPRWRAYEQIPTQEISGAISVYRPAYLQLPGFKGILRPDLGAYLSCGRHIKARHKKHPYDAILAFNLIGAGGLAWRLARCLDIPAAGWATGNDVRVDGNSAHGRSVRAAIQRLDIVFYQSSELFDRAAALCELPEEDFPAGRRLILPRGVEPAPSSNGSRRSIREALGVRDDQVLALFLGRVVKAKGVFELVDAVERARQEQPNVTCVFVGSHDAFDDSKELRARLERTPKLAPYIRVMPACAPDKVWDYFHAADIFAFPSHSEGMPNSLLEAMSAALPAIAYAIPPILEIDGQSGALLTVPLRDVSGFARVLVQLARSTELRQEIGGRAKARVLSHYQTRASMAEAVKRLGALTRSDRKLSFSTGAAIPSRDTRGSEVSKSI
jgi:teichuronic acid biosynthesis glycosyltransferase TuaC